MPRGRRKRGQFLCKVWTPKGARLEWSTTADKTLPEHVEDLRRMSDELKRLADVLEKRGDA